MKEINQYFTDIYFHLHPLQEQTISHQAVRILQVIQKRHDVTIRHIAEHLHISQNTASEHVKKLEEQKWLTKNRSEQDQRKVLLQLTNEGLKVLREHSELDEKKLRVVWEKLTDEQQQSIVAAFRLLSEVSSACKSL